MGFAKGVSSTNESNCCSIIVTHALERVTHVLGAERWVWVWWTACLHDWSLRIQIDEADCRCSKRLTTHSVDFTWRNFLLLSAWSQRETLHTVVVISTSKTHLSDGGAHIAKR